MMLYERNQLIGIMIKMESRNMLAVSIDCSNRHMPLHK